MTPNDGCQQAKPRGKGSTAQVHRSIGARSLGLISPAATSTLRGMPSVADYGRPSIACCAPGAMLLFIPQSFVVAELASSRPKSRWAIADPDEVPVDAGPQTYASALSAWSATAAVLAAGSAREQPAAG